MQKIQIFKNPLKRKPKTFQGIVTLQHLKGKKKTNKN
jgi:hypothetical protein